MNSVWTQNVGRVVHVLLVGAALGALGAIQDVSVLNLIPKPLATAVLALVPIVSGLLGQKSFKVNPDGTPASSAWAQVPVSGTNRKG